MNKLPDPDPDLSDYPYMPNKIKYCPICKLNSIKVIYYGLPHRLCEDGSCSCIFGFWSSLTDYLSFNSYLFVYTGSYFKALPKWLFNK